MSVIVNIVASCSNVGKTTLIEGVIRELKKQNYSVSTIKHDVHGFDIDKEGKDTWRHRKAGAENVIISSSKRMAIIKEVENEVNLRDLIDYVKESDFILIEGYKKSKYRKIEVFRRELSKRIITPKDKLIAIASDVQLDIIDIPIIHIDDYKSLAKVIISLK